jgi:hypothetical protein
MGLIKKPRSDDLVQPFPLKRWDFYRTAQAVTQGDQIITGDGGGGNAFPFPESGIIGFIHATGSGAAPAFVRLRNPAGSGVELWVYELGISLALHATSATIFGQRTSTPTSLSSPLVGAPQRLDEQDITPILGVLEGKDGAGTILTESTGIFPANGTTEGNSGWKPYPIRQALEAPIIILPGSAIEFTADTNSASTKLRLMPVWDERTSR